MSVKHQKIKLEPKSIEDDLNLSEELKMVEEKKSEEVLDEKKLDDLKNKLAKKKAAEKKTAPKKATPKGDEMPPKIVEKKRRSLEFGVIGLGQGGSRLAEEWHRLGYLAVCANTTSQDLEYIQLPGENKLLLEYTIGGAAKDLDIGLAAAEANRDGLNALVRTKLESAQIFVVCTSLGGGSGAGSVPVVVDLLSPLGKPIVVMAILPMNSDDATTKANSLETLSKLSKLVKNKQVCNLIVADNAKIEGVFHNVGQLDFFKTANRAIVETVDAFNVMSTWPSFEKPIDAQEWAKILVDGEGLSLYGSTTVGNFADSDVAIAEAVMNNLEGNLLAGGFDLSSAKYGGVIFAANKAVWEQVPASSVNYAMSLIREMSNGSVEATFKGLFVDESMEENVIKILSFFSGLGLPTPRVTELQEQAKAELEKTKQRAQERAANLTLESGVSETMSEAEKVKQLIQKKSSSFTKNFGVDVKDMRKKK